MASTQKFLNHLLQGTGITPACSEEERAAAEEIASIFANHGFEPEMQEFNASSSAKMVQAVLGIALFLGTLLMVFGGVLGIVGLLLAIAATVLFVMESQGNSALSGLGGNGLSQNVIAYHKASGPMASPRNRPVVVVAHYDSPRADLLSQMPFATYRPLLAKLLPFVVMVPAVVGVLRLFPLPGAAKVVLWLLALFAALIPLAQAVAIIANRFVLPYTSGAVCNKSSVAAMLGIMEAVSPYRGGDEFPEDTPFEEYMAEQEEIAAAMLAALETPTEEEVPVEEAVGEVVDGEPVDADVQAPMPDATASMDGSVLSQGIGATSEMAGIGETQAFEVDGAVADDGSATEVVAEVGETYEEDSEVVSAAPADEETVVDEVVEDGASLPVNAQGNIRYGAEVIRSLGMLSDACRLVYEDEDDAEESAVAAEESVDVVEDVEDAAPVEDEVSEVETEMPYGGESLDDDDADDEELSVPAAFADLTAAAYVEEFSGEQEIEPAVEDEPAFEVDADAEAEDAPLEKDDPFDAAPVDISSEVEDEAEVSEEEGALDATQVFEAPAADAGVEDDDQPDMMGATKAMPVQPAMDTVDTLMAQIDAANPARPAQVTTASAAPVLRQIPPVVPDASALQGARPVNRAALFDVPDPSEAPSDPFAAPSSAAEPSAPSRNGFTVIGPNDPVPAASSPASAPASDVQTISAPAPTEEKPKRGLARLFSRKKKKQESMSEWLGVDEGFDAKQSGGEIGSWDNFDADDKGWKGGATGVEGATDEELRDAITSLGDDELLGHDIWFVATGASECGNAGIKAFLNTHRDKLRGVFLINLESVGAGRVAMLATEGENRVLKGDKRIMKLVSRVSADFHNEFGAIDMPFMNTDAHAAMSMSLRSLTLAGVDSTHLACAHSEEDQPYNVDAGNVQMVADVVTEVIRRS